MLASWAERLGKVSKCSVGNQPCHSLVGTRRAAMEWLDTAVIPVARVDQHLLWATSSVSLKYDLDT